jgi:hypothetical protein
VKWNQVTEVLCLLLPGPQTSYSNGLHGQILDASKNLILDVDSRSPQKEGREEAWPAWTEISMRERLFSVSWSQAFYWYSALQGSNDRRPVGVVENSCGGREIERGGLNAMAAMWPTACWANQKDGVGG